MRDYFDFSKQLRELRLMGRQSSCRFAVLCVVVLLRMLIGLLAVMAPIFLFFLKFN
jgi:hypothetical protein